MEDFIAKTIEKSLTNVDYIDVRICTYENNVIRLINGMTKDLINSHEIGIGIRAFKNGTWAFSSSSDLSKEAIKKMVDNVTLLVNTLERKSKIKFKLNEPKIIENSWKSLQKKDIQNISIEEKIEYVKDIYKQSIAHDKRIFNSNVLYFDSIIQEKILNSSGLRINLTTSYVRNVTSNYALDGNRRQFALKSVGGVGGWEIVETEKARKLGILASEQDY